MRKEWGKERENDRERKIEKEKLGRRKGKALK